MELKDWLSVFFSFWSCTVSTIALILTFKGKKKNRSRKPGKHKRKR